MTQLEKEIRECQSVLKLTHDYVHDHAQNIDVETFNTLLV